ncbi:hypothetical protein Peur_073864 [Populus x canadensis]|jgi:hypothetical protein
MVLGAAMSKFNVSFSLLLMDALTSIKYRREISGFILMCDFSINKEIFIRTIHLYHHLLHLILMCDFLFVFR